MNSIGASSDLPSTLLIGIRIFHLLYRLTINYLSETVRSWVTYYNITHSDKRLYNIHTAIPSTTFLAIIRFRPSQTSTEGNIVQERENLESSD